MALASWMLLADEPQLEEILVKVNGHEMHCLKTGKGPELVLLHGLLGSADAWYPCLSRLGQDSSVYAVDSLGIGRSERVRRTRCQSPGTGRPDGEFPDRGGS